MRSAILVAVLLAGCATAQAQAPATAQCLPAAGFSRADLEALKAAEWAVPDDTRRDALARALTACLGDPDPSVRDGFAFEAYAHWLRGRVLSNETKLWLADDLERRLVAPEGAGFERPFAALVLSEVARADRVEPYLTPARRAQMVDASIAYFTGIRDYRGFDNEEGWRHGVAHGSDVLLQLAVNPALGRPELTRLRDAVATQLAPDDHVYVATETERLVRPVVFIAQRGVFTAEEWQAWLVASTAVGDGAFSSERGLARRQNMINFLSILYMQVRLSPSEADDVLLPGVEAALQALP